MDRGRSLGELVNGVAWRWRARLRPLHTDPRAGMAAFIDGLLRSVTPHSFEEVSRIHALCHSRDARSPHQHGSGSTRVADCNFLYLLVRWLRPRTVFEVGTLIGTSASSMAHALAENGDGGVLYTVDGSYGGFEPLSGHAIRCFPGQRSDAALETMETERRRIDFAFVDGTIARRDIELLNQLKSDAAVVALHDYKPPADKGIRNAWLLARFFEEGESYVWLLPERQGVGYQVGQGISINSSVAVLVPKRLAVERCAAPST